MTNIVITKDSIEEYNKYIEETVDWDIKGNPIKRMECYPYSRHGKDCELVTFIAGYQLGLSKSAKPN